MRCLTTLIKKKCMGARTNYKAVGETDNRNRKTLTRASIIENSSSQYFNPWQIKKSREFVLCNY